MNEMRNMSELKKLYSEETGKQPYRCIDISFRQSNRVEVCPSDEYVTWLESQITKEAKDEGEA